MAVRIAEWRDLTPELIRTWGYDDDLILMEQDEDLLLYDVEFIPVLLELAADDRCPKQQYAFFILCQFCRERITRGGQLGMAEISAAYLAVTRPEKGYGAEWHSYVGRMLDYTEPRGAVDRATAQQMAEDLLVGVAGRVGKVVEGTPVVPGWWRFILRTSVTEHVEICQSTGAFSYKLVF